ncbi:MAG: glycosyltransferase [Pseudomonadota bacterium]
MNQPTFHGLRIALAGPCAPPAGGMANQTAQLARLLADAGAQVELVPTNRPPRQAWLAPLRGLRALVRLLPYLGALWQAAGRADIVHIMANSGWAWHLHAAPAVWIGRMRRKGVLVHYHGGEAAAFLARQGRLVTVTLGRAHAIVVPSDFLAQVFRQHGLAVQILPNVVDLARFSPGPPASRPGPMILVCRHLEPLYDHATALRAFRLLRLAVPHAQLTIAGDGPELARLRRLAGELDVADAVVFAGALDQDGMASLYRQADAVLNPSLADNMPVSILEALASGVPVVSTDVGGIPCLLEHGHTGLLAAPGDAETMARHLLSILHDTDAAQRMAAAGLRLAQRYTWQEIGPRLLAQYRRLELRPRAGWYKDLVARPLFLLQERIKHHAGANLLRRLETSQWLSPAHLRQLQLQRLQALLRHAGRHVPYYQAQFARLGFDPAKVHDLRDLRCLPILGKRDISGQRDAFRSDVAGPLQRGNTGGSSGEPLIFYLGRDRVSHDVAAKWRATRWWGVDIGEPEAVVWGSPIELGAQDRWRAWRDRLLRTSLLPAFQMSTPRLDDYLQRLQHQRPRMVFGYPSALCHIARHAQARRVRLDTLGVRVVFVTAERLYDEQRKLLSATFGCPVANGYGGRDAGFIAHECPEGGMHLSAEDVIVEIVDAHGQPVPDGTPGAIVVTHLASADFPFIRYATGDVGALGTAPCPCGRGLPLLEKLEGRSTDFVVARDGTVMHGLALIYILRDIAQVRAFKIVQESLLLTRVLLVCVPALGEEMRRHIATQFQARLGADVAIDIAEVPEIAAEASGKYRYVVSKVAAPS